MKILLFFLLPTFPPKWDGNYICPVLFFQSVLNYINWILDIQIKRMHT